MQVKEKPRDNDRLKFQPEYQNVEADYWKMKYLEAVIELQNANRGIAKLVKRKKMWSDTAGACKTAFSRGYDDCLGEIKENYIVTKK